MHQERNRAPYRLYAPAFVLAPLRAKSEAPESFGMPRPEECAVLYLSYCLSEDQSWLLAAATDDRGEIFETATINIDIPNRKRRKRASARRIGLQKLMDFILGVMSQGVSKQFIINSHKLKSTIIEFAITNVMKNYDSNSYWSFSLSSKIFFYKYCLFFCIKLF